MKYLLSIIIIISIQFNLIAQQNYKLIKSEVKIEGTSNVHDWVSDVTKLESKANINVRENNDIDVKKLSITIPVTGIISTKGSIMDKKTWAALKYKESHNIIYDFVKMETLSKKGNKMSMLTWGNLTVAGKTRYISMEVTAEIQSEGKIKFKGNKKLKMTSFGIDPPTALMGMMTTGDDLNIVFTILIETNNSTIMSSM